MFARDVLTEPLLMPTMSGYQLHIDSTILQYGIFNSLATTLLNNEESALTTTSLLV